MTIRRPTFALAFLLAFASLAAAEPSPDWLSRVRQGIADSEYEISRQPDGWQAPNRSENLRTTFTEAGIRVVPRTEADPSWTWGLTWIGYGRGATTWEVPAASLDPKGARIDYRRGPLAEWYDNSPRGLKQGFVMTRPPEELNGARRDDSGVPIHLDLALSGDLRPVISDDRQAIDFEAPGGSRVLHYAQLEVTDARQTKLRAWMEGFARSDARGIRIVIEDRDAVYPITVDPLATSPAWTAESDQAGASFGWSVTTAGDVNGDGYSDVIVGAPNYDDGQTDEGRAYVFLGAPSGLSATPAWTVESNAAYSVLGRSVGTAGDVNGDGFSDVIVGAPYFSNDQTNEGRAFVYLGSAGGLSTTPAWTRESDQASAYFGTSVDTAGDVNGDGFSDVIVGAESYDNGQTDEGRAFVYLGSASGLASSPVWTGESDQANARFGIAVQTAGDVNGDGYADVIVGAYAYDNGEADEGRAYVYLGSASGPLSTASWTAESDQATAYFGWSVGTAGDVNGDGYADVVVGAYAYDATTTNEGRASVYLGSASGLSASPAWTVAGGQGWAIFGYSVGTAGDVNGDGYADVIVGAYNYDNGQTDEGRAIVYLGSRTGLSTTPAWTAESDQASASFGYSVGTAGDVNGDGYSDVVVGAINHDNGQTDEGRAFVYLGSATGLVATATWMAETDQEGAKFGISVATAGDVNGDGYSDVIVGAYLYDNGQADEGRASVFLGSAAGLAASPAWTAESDQANAWFGWSVATAGDVNGDGYSDVIVGARYYDNGQADEGRAFVYLGSVSGLAATAAWTAESDQANAWFGEQVATAGDVNGDGYSDVIVGASYYDNGQADEGRAFVYLGSVSGLAATPAWTAESDQTSAWFGSSVATAGDVNGDGYSDVIVGALAYDNAEVNEGRAYVYLGSASGLAASTAWTAESNQASALFGSSVATAGDVNGDGYSDVIVGVYRYDNGQMDEGRAFVYLGSASGLAASAAWTAESDQANAFFGSFVATAGDVNGDGYSDVIVGAYYYDNGHTDEGRAFVYLGSVSGLAASAAWTAESDQAFALFGYSVATAGDVNGDGYSDVIVGAQSYDNGETDEGRAYVYYGNGGGGLSLRPRQRRTDDVAPIAPLGWSDSPMSFRLNLTGRTPFGRGLVRAQWETRSLGSLFDGAGLQVGTSWSNTGTSGVDLSEISSGLAAGDRVHWRARLLYNPATVPFQSHSRWLTGGWNGAQETDLRTRTAADFVVWQIDTPDPQFEGQWIDYHVVVTNLGPSESAATLTDTIPTGSGFQSVTTSQGSCVEATGIVSCVFGTIASGATVDVHVTVVAPPGWTNALNTAVVSVAPALDPYPANNTSLQSTQVAATNIGDFVWRDDDGDGIHDPGEPGFADVVVLLYDGVGGLIGSAETNANGYYALMQPVYGVLHNLRFVLPDGFVFSPRDQGSDDTMDSDADPATGETIVFPLADVADTGRWDAGLVPDADGDGAFLPADCNEADPNVRPGAVELCNGWDDDCDGVTDETCDAQCDVSAELADETDLTPTATNAGAPRIVWTGAEYGMVVSDNRDGNYEIYFARFDAAFGRIGGDVRLTSAIGSSVSPYLAWTGTEYGVVWQDDRDGNNEIYFARLDASGTKIGDDVRVTSVEGTSQRPRIAWSGISYGLLWNDVRAGTSQNYFVELAASGTPLGTEQRITPLPYSAPSGRFDWTGSVYGVVYGAVRDGTQHVWFQTLDRHGNVVTPETSVTSSTGVIRTPAIAWDGISQFGISWVDNRSGADQLFFTRVAADGTKLTGDHPLVAIVSSASIPQMLVHSGGEWALTWIDQAVGNAEIYFGRIAGDALADVPVRVTDNPATAQNPDLEWNGTEYAIAFAENREGASTYHAFASRIGCCTVSTIGDRVWRDADVDGIQDAGEAGVPGTLVAVYDGTGALLGASSSGADGAYQLPGLSCGSTYELRFFPPGSEYLSPQNQGADDALDSDPDPATGSTGTFVLSSSSDAAGWDAGIAACWPPDEPVYIASVGRTADGNDYPILNFQDPNQPEQVSGYNIYRSDTPGAAWPWPLVATDVVDMDAGTPNLQWVDTSGDVSPTGAWYYQVTAYNHRCPAEGPR